MTEPDPTRTSSRSGRRRGPRRRLFTSDALLDAGVMRSGRRVACDGFAAGVARHDDGTTDAEWAVPVLGVRRAVHFHLCAECVDAYLMPARLAEVVARLCRGLEKPPPAGRPA
jgi:hypothetical protein